MEVSFHLLQKTLTLFDIMAGHNNCVVYVTLVKCNFKEQLMGLKKKKL